MSSTYKAVGWNRQKKIYDRVLIVSIVAYLALFTALHALFIEDFTPETVLIRGLGSAAMILLHITLAIGPACRLDTRLLPLLYNRRHLGVTLFILGFSHAALATFQFHGFSDVSPLISIFTSNTQYLSLTQFPFETLGVVALLILFLMAATSHDFWLANLTAPTWKKLHMMVYVAYLALLGHVLLGVLQSETSWVLALVLGFGACGLLILHVVAAVKERQKDTELCPQNWTDVASIADIPESRARTYCLSGERIAIFKHEGKIFAVSGVCQHQNGPLGEGKIIDGCITCPWHGYQYVPEDGTSPAPFTEKIPVFQVKIDSGRIWVNPQPFPPGTRLDPANIDGGNHEKR